LWLFFNGFFAIIVCIRLEGYMKRSCCFAVLLTIGVFSYILSEFIMYTIYNNLGENIFNILFGYFLYGIIFAGMFLSYRYMRQVYIHNEYALKERHLKELKVIYLLLLLILLYFRIPSSNDGAYNFLPLMLDQYFSFSFTNPVWIFNFIIFIPYPFLFDIKWFYTIIIFVLIEVLQLLLSVGSFDINDIIFYIMGYVVGLVIRYFIRRKQKNNLS